MTNTAEARLARTCPIAITVVRGVDDYLRAVTVRSLVYIGEQKCPFLEEFDGNDFAGATHLLAHADDEPVGTLRLRWFADFAKLERVAVLPGARNGETARALIDAAMELAARKGYRRLLGHVDVGLVSYWRRTRGANIRDGRPRFRFSDHEYVEVEVALDTPHDVITTDTAPLVLLRPEGAWDEPGVLDRSAERGALKAVEASWRVTR